MTSRPYLDFYGRHGIIPVRQDLSDPDLHFRRREALYRHLGLWPAVIRGRRILEIGPGTGDNALYTAALRPDAYVLLDGNAASIAALTARQADGLLPAGVEIIQADLMAWDDPRRFDVVLCEGLLPAQNDQGRFLERVASYCAADGIVVVTTVSGTSLFAETCRRVIRPLFERRADSLERLVAVLARFFAPDLNSLPGMSRLHTDWVLDQIIHPYGETPFFSLSEAIATLDGGFEVIGTSPAILTDWRWYKSVPQSARSRNELALDRIGRLSASLIDYRMEPVETDFAVGHAIEHQSRLIWKRHLEVLDRKDPAAFPPFLDEVRRLRTLLPESFADTRRSIDDYLAGMTALLDGRDDPDFGTFRTLFGRGQQYLAMMRRFGRP